MHTDLRSYDHYVAQTYLRQFACSQDYVFVCRKKEKLNKLMPSSSICGEKGGDICNHLDNPYALREFLSVIEPAWNLFVKSMEQTAWTQDNAETIYKGCLYIAYLRLLSPRTILMFQEIYQGVLNTILIKNIEKIKDLSESQKAFISEGKIKIQVNDPEYFKCSALNQIAEISQYIYSRNWTILLNKTDINFVTSDTPLIFNNYDLKDGLIKFSTPAFMPMYLPITPKIGLIIQKEEGNKVDYKNITDDVITVLNREIVKFASDLVICSTEDPAIIEMVNRYRDYKPGVVFDEIKLPYSSIITMQQKPTIVSQ